MKIRVLIPVLLISIYVGSCSWMDPFQSPEKTYKETLGEIRRSVSNCIAYPKPYEGESYILNEFLERNNLPESSISATGCFMLGIRITRDMDSLIIPNSMNAYGGARVVFISGSSNVISDSIVNSPPRIAHAIGFENFRSLVSIVFNDVGISSIPTGLFSLDSIHTIEISYSYINSLEGMQESFARIANSLGYLHVDNSQITMFPENIFDVVSDFTMSISSNQICSLSIEQMTRVQELVQGISPRNQKLYFEPQICDGQPKYLRDYE